MANACTSISPRAPQFISEDLRVSRVIDKFAGRAKEEIPRIIPAGRAIDAVSNGRWMSQGVPAAKESTEDRGSRDSRDRDISSRS